MSLVLLYASGRAGSWWPWVSLLVIAGRQLVTGDCVKTGSGSDVDFLSSLVSVVVSLLSWYASSDFLRWTLFQRFFCLSSVTTYDLDPILALTTAYSNSWSFVLLGPWYILTVSLGLKSESMRAPRSWCFACHSWLDSNFLCCPSGICGCNSLAVVGNTVSVQRLISLCTGLVSKPCVGVFR